MYSKDELIIGSHVSMSGTKYFLGSALETINNKANALMFYTGSPQSNRRTEISKCKIEEGISLLKNNGIDSSNIVCHAPYLINIASELSTQKSDFAKELLIQEIYRCHAFGSRLLVLHPGCHVGQGKEVGIKNIVAVLNEVLKDIDFDIVICLETMAGKGSEIGSTLEEIKAMIDLIEHKDKIGVCIDTCHLNDAGYDVTDSDKFLDLFDEIVGLSYLKVCHLNDSLNKIGAHKDRHANIGLGTIGFEALRNFAFNPKIKDVPKILETPYINDKSPYKLEIEMLRSGDFDSSKFFEL